MSHLLCLFVATFRSVCVLFATKIERKHLLFKKVDRRRRRNEAKIAQIWFRIAAGPNFGEGRRKIMSIFIVRETEQRLLKRKVLAVEFGKRFHFVEYVGKTFEYFPFVWQDWLSSFFLSGFCGFSQRKIDAWAGSEAINIGLKCRQNKLISSASRRSRRAIKSVCVFVEWLGVASCDAINAHQELRYANYLSIRSSQQNASQRIDLHKFKSKAYTKLFCPFISSCASRGLSPAVGRSDGQR